MKFSRNSTALGAVFFAGLLILNHVTPVHAEEAAPATETMPEKAQVLLDQVKKTELDRDAAARQTAIDRLKEDGEKNKKDAESLQKIINNTGDKLDQSNKHYEELNTERKRLQRDLNIANARIEAEGQRIDGLRALGAAQSKSLSALNSHIQEADVRGQLQTALMQAIAEGKIAAGDDGEDRKFPELLKLRKALNSAQAKTATDESQARSAMKAAAAKVQSADLAAARAQKLADETNAERTEATNLKPAPVEDVPN